MRISPPSLLSERPQEDDRTRAALVEAAAQEFAAHGYERARVDAIASRARLNKRALYDYFGDKRALFRAALLERLARLPRPGPRDGAQGPAEALEAYFRTCCRCLAGDPALAQLLARAMVSGDQELQGLVRDAARAALAALEELLRAAGAAGAVRLDLEADLIQTVMVAACLAHGLRHVPSPSTAVRELPGQEEEHLDGLWSLLSRGLRP